MIPIRILAVFAIAALPATAHDHYAAGISDTNLNGIADAGEPLAFVGGDGTSKVFHLLARPVGFRPVQRCGGYYMLDERPRTLFPNDSFSIIALSDGQYEIETAKHAHTGAWIWCEIVSVTGPPGGHFGFWDQDHSFYFDEPTVSLAANQPTGAVRFAVGEGIDDVNEDPFGHIHGRSWTADKAGDYQVGFRLIDLSTTGPGGGPWHGPSPVYIYHFQAGPDFKPKGALVKGAGFVLTWPSQMGTYEPSQTGIVFKILRSTSAAPGSWTTIGSVTGTTANDSTFTDSSPPAGRAFYRLAYDWAAP